MMANLDILHVFNKNIGVNIMVKQFAHYKVGQVTGRRELT